MAAEVRSLAQRSASAAKEIKVLITDSVESVDAGSKQAQQAQQAGETLTDVVNSVQRVSDIVGEISVAAVEQSQGVAELNQAVADLDQATQQNSALVEESAAAALSLRDQAKALSEMVQRFRLAPAAVGTGPNAAAFAPASKIALAPARAPAMIKSAVRKSVPAPVSKPVVVTEKTDKGSDWKTF